MSLKTLNLGVALVSDSVSIAVEEATSGFLTADGLESAAAAADDPTTDEDAAAGAELPLASPLRPTEKVFTGAAAEAGGGGD